VPRTRVANLVICRAEKEYRGFTVPRAAKLPKFESRTYPIFLGIGTGDERAIVALPGTALGLITYLLACASALPCCSQERPCWSREEHCGSSSDKSTAPIEHCRQEVRETLG
jgi:hypothetical protein